MTVRKSALEADTTLAPATGCARMPPRAFASGGIRVQLVKSSAHSFTGSHAGAPQKEARAAEANANKMAPACVMLVLRGLTAPWNA